MKLRNNLVDLTCDNFIQFKCLTIKPPSWSNNDISLQTDKTLSFFCDAINQLRSTYLLVEKVSEIILIIYSMLTNVIILNDKILMNHYKFIYKNLFRDTRLNTSFSYFMSISKISWNFIRALLPTSSLQKLWNICLNVLMF